MGYSVIFFQKMMEIELDEKKILDVGSQDVTISSFAELQIINEFIQKNNPKSKTLNLDSFPVKVEAREVFIRAGFDYTCIDVDERPHTLRVDLAKFEIPREFRNTFDLVVNVGTTEHLASPAATFALMHEVCKVGGVLYNDVPLFGMGNHGLINPTPKYWHAMIWMNQYKVESISTLKVEESLNDSGNFYHDYLSYIIGLNEIKDISYLITAIFRKTKQNFFIVPYDPVLPNDEGESLAQLLVGSYYPFMKTGAYEPEEIMTSVNQFLELNCKKYRIPSVEFIFQNDLVTI